MEDPEVLRQRQQVQQSKSIHELAKIGNVNQFPLPFKLPLPDIPLPKPSRLFRRNKKKQKKKQVEPSPLPPIESTSLSSPSPVSPDRTDDEMLRYEASDEETGEEREQDFGYEIIEQQMMVGNGEQQQVDEHLEEETAG